MPSNFTVTNLLDSPLYSLPAAAPPGSFRAAVAAANANPGADTIDFATSGTIALTNGASVRFPVGGTEMLVPLTIGCLTVAGNWAVRQSCSWEGRPATYEVSGEGWFQATLRAAEGLLPRGGCSGAAS